MPQVCATRRQGVALDFDLTKTPAPVYIDAKRNCSREHRASARSLDNILLVHRESGNDYDHQRWHGNGFPGHVQFVPYIGRDAYRPGVKLERDVQQSTMPHEMGKPLNVTQMGKSVDKIRYHTLPPEEEVNAHEEAVATMRAHRSYACEAHRVENGHSHHRSQLDLWNERQQRLEEAGRAVPNMRSAGLPGINERLGTCGSLPDLTRVRGPHGIQAWRTCTPWALHEGQ
mmetsp:Transcript_53413/g.117100  ORF Transcript_53413/g.117100 Transcript_53413/m.117100 type:complete len:229 (-) Transcript_53413:166-852(-)